jgi:hypothetical protein
VATTIASATLKVTLKEDIVLNGRQQGGESVLSIAGVNEISKRIVTVPITLTEMLAFSDQDGQNGRGTYKVENVRYVRITNLDDTYHAVLKFKNENNDETAMLLDKGQTFIYNGNLSDKDAGGQTKGLENTMDAVDNATLTIALGDLSSISASAAPDSAAAGVDLEIFVASV